MDEKQERSNPNLLSDGRRIPPIYQLQHPIAEKALKSARSSRELANKSKTVADFLHWYDQLLTDLEDLSKLNKVSFTTPPSHDIYKLKEEFQLHLCDAIVRAKEETLEAIRGKYRNCKEFQEMALADFERDIEKAKDRFSPWSEELARKSIEEVDQVVHPVACAPSRSDEDEQEAIECLPTKKITYSDEMFIEAVDVILETEQASVSVLQRRLKLGYARAARIIDEMEKNEIVGQFRGVEPRAIFITKNQWKVLKPSAKYTPDENSFEKKQDKTLLTEAENTMLKAKLAVALAEKENLERSIKQDLKDKMTVAKAELLTIDLMEGHDFENWCAEALRNSGFTNVTVTPGSGDQGVDIVAEKDGLRYAVQCKRYNSDLGNTPVQEVFTGARFYNCHVGVVITNRNFTSGAKDAAAATGVLLWGRSWILQYLYQKHGVMPEADPNA